MSTSSLQMLIDRDESTLAFNERVLDMARRPHIPLLERLRYLCIVSSNLDEFFEVRVALHLHQIQNKSLSTPYSFHTYQRISQSAQALVEKQYKLSPCYFVFKAKIALKISPLFLWCRLLYLQIGRQNSLNLHQVYVLKFYIPLK